MIKYTLYYVEMYIVMSIHRNTQKHSIHSLFCPTRA